MKTAAKVESRRLVRPNSVYEPQIVCMKEQDGDRLIEKVRKRGKKGKKLTRKDISPLILTPLMDGRSSERERICQVMDLIQGEGTIS